MNLTIRDDILFLMLIIHNCKWTRFIIIQGALSDFRRPDD